MFFLLAYQIPEKIPPNPNLSPNNNLSSSKRTCCILLVVKSVLSLDEAAWPINPTATCLRGICVHLMNGA